MHKQLKRMLSFLLVLILVISNLTGCGQKESTTQETPAASVSQTQIVEELSDIIRYELTNTPKPAESDRLTDVVNPSEQINRDNIESFSYALLKDNYDFSYETFSAAIYLEDGTEISGTAYTDFTAYLESDDETRGYFPAGFIPNLGEEYSINQIEGSVEVYNLDYENERYGFVLAYTTESYFEHYVKDGQYVKYGIDEDGSFVCYSEQYIRGNIDESLGALYSYDEDRYLYYPDEMDGGCLTGESLFAEIDYDELEAEVNRILDEQDAASIQLQIESAAYFSQDTVKDYLLSLQKETFLGLRVEELVAEVENLYPNECYRITPSGKVLIDIDGDVPEEPTAMAKWLVGAGCAIAVIGSSALNIFIPAARPLSGAFTGAAIEVFMQVVFENAALQSIQWSKVAVAATSGVLMAWACPLGASKIAELVGHAGASKVLTKIAGYGFLTFSNAIVSGVTNASFSLIDNDGNALNAFWAGAAVGASCTAMASVLDEAAQAGMNALKASKPNNWFVKITEKTGEFIGKHQVHLKNQTVEDILNPKSVYEAAKYATNEVKTQVSTVSQEKTGGRYDDLRVPGDGMEVHETPSFGSTGADVRKDGPSIKMSVEDHRKTASWGNSNDAKAYRNQQKAYIKSNDWHSAIQMDIDDIRSKFGNKYDDAIEQMLEYAKEIGWW